MKRKAFILTISGLAVVLSGCSSMNPQEVMANVMDDNATPEKYYLETEITYTDDDFEETFHFKEWRDDVQYRIEIHESLGVTTTVEDLDQSMTYLDEEDVVLVTDNQGQPAEEINYLDDFYNLEEVQNMQFSLENEEEILGRDTYVLSIEDEVPTQLWVDQSTWMILRWERGALTTEAVEYEVDPNWDDDPFVLEYPDSAEVINTEDEDDAITLNEINDLFASEVRIHTDDSAIELWEMYQHSQEVILEYFKDQSPYLTMTIAEAENDILHTNNEEVEQIDTFATISIYELPGDDYALSWEEDGLYYNVFPESMEVSLEELEAFAESLYIES